MRKTHERVNLNGETGGEREILPSKNSDFMARAGKDMVGEMRTEIEGKKRRDRDMEGGGKKSRK